MRVAVLINPGSGRRQGETIAAAAIPALSAAGHDVVTVRGDDADAAHDELRHQVGIGLDAVVVIGGDGALHGVLDLVADTDLVLGLLPAGTGNDTARALGIPLKDPVTALDVVLSGQTRTIDLARADGRYVATVVASGFDSKVSERASTMRWPSGRLRYQRAIVAELREFEPLPFTITLDGRTIERHAMLVAVGNGPSFGGGLRICEGASIDDGLLDVVIINPVSRLKLLQVLPQLRTGAHTGLAEFERHRVREVTLSSPGIVAYGDGERLGPLPTTTTICPAALRVFTPSLWRPAT